MCIASAHILLTGAWAQGCVNLRGSWNVSTSSPEQIKANGCLLRNSEPPPAPRTVVSFDFLGAGVFDFTSNLTSLNLRSEMLDLFISSNTGGDVWGRTHSVCVAKDEIKRHSFLLLAGRTIWFLSDFSVFQPARILATSGCQWTLQTL